MLIRCFWTGNGKDILVPFKEQARPMEKGKRYLVPIHGRKTNRLVAKVRPINSRKTMYC
jgi:predicted RNA-binding protein (virulence factor B family)